MLWLSCLNEDFSKVRPAPYEAAKWHQKGLEAGRSRIDLPKNKPRESWEPGISHLLRLMGRTDSRPSAECAYTRGRPSRFQQQAQNKLCTQP